MLIVLSSNNITKSYYKYYKRYVVKFFDILVGAEDLSTSQFILNVYTLKVIN